MMPAGVPELLDHIVLATPDLAATSAAIGQVTGVRPSTGGPHVGRGTRNDLCALGEGIYLEIIGPDPDQPEPAEARPFAIDRLAAAGVVTWCAKGADLGDLVSRAGAAGLAYDGPTPMQRQAPEGQLEWELALPTFDTAGGTIPFFIDWGQTPHPAASRGTATGLTVDAFMLVHPRPGSVQSQLAALGIDATVELADTPGVRAVVQGPGGSMALESAVFA